MNKIKILNKELINLIAAGEVVERPASVVKELLENAIDAKASQIQVYIEDFGLTKIEVKDNGFGMSSEDAVLAFTQHATSKIIDKDDLYSINTLGFRGEALASIAEVSKETSIETKEEESVSSKVVYKDGIYKEVSKKTNTGTVVTVNYLFENIPARKKFLKSGNTELKNIINTFLQVSLTYKEIHFELFHNSSLLYRLTKTNDLKTRILEAFGKNTATNLYESEIEINGLKIYGLIGKPEIAKSTNPNQYLYINKRFVKSPLIASSVNQAFQGFIHKALKPSYFLFIDINPSEIDINIHPRKLEIKFQDENLIFKSIYKFIKQVLENSTKNDFIESIANKPIEDNFSKKISEPKINYSTKNNFSFTPKNKNKDSINQAINFTKELYTNTKDLFDSVLSNANIEDKFNIFNPSSVFQLFNTYILFEKDEELIFLDQHAAAEKINFEKLLKQYSTNILTKPLLMPEIIDLSNKASKDEIMTKQEMLNQVGFIIEDFGGNSIQIKEIPEILDKPDFRSIIEDVINNENLEFIVDEDERASYNVSKEIYLILASIACHGSIRAGQRLTEAEMKKIVTELLKLQNPSTCPHGRPVIWKLTRYELEKNFKRNI